MSSSPSYRCAIFPMPECVALPGHTLSFHIFEPRYRRMVRDCVEQGIPLGIALGAKKLPHHPVPGQETQSLMEALNSNQESYEPAAVLGAGHMRIVRELSDGRFLIDVRIRERVRLLDTVQEVPYLVAQVEAYPYRRSSETKRATLAARIMELSARLLAGEASTFRALVPWVAQAGRELEMLVFMVMTWLKVPTEASQKLMDLTTDQELASTVISWLEICEAHIRASEATVRPLFNGEGISHEGDRPDDLR